MEIKVGDRVIRNPERVNEENIGCSGLSINTEYTVECITPSGNIVLEGYLILLYPEDLIVVKTNGCIERTREDICEDIIYALSTRDFTEEEKSHLLSNETSREIIIDWCHPDIDPGWTENNKDWFYKNLNSTEKIK